MKTNVDEQQVRQDVGDALHRVMHNHVIFQRILDVFFGSLDEHLTQLTDAHTRADREKCITLLHKLGSGANSIGACELGAVLKQIETETKDFAVPLFDVSLIKAIEQLAMSSQQAINKCMNEL